MVNIKVDLGTPTGVAFTPETFPVGSWFAFNGEAFFVQGWESGGPRGVKTARLVSFSEGAVISHTFVEDKKHLEYIPLDKNKLNLSLDFNG